MMDTIGSHWEDPEKVLNILDNRIKKGILFDMVLKKLVIEEDNIRDLELNNLGTGYLFDHIY